MRTFFYDCSCGASWNAASGNRCPSCRQFYFGPRRTLNVGKVTDHKCDSRCTNATGHTCNCACGGKNHGMYALRFGAAVGGEANDPSTAAA